MFAILLRMNSFTGIFLMDLAIILLYLYFHHIDSQEPQTHGKSTTALLFKPFSSTKISIFVLRVNETRRGVMGVVRNSQIVMQKFKSVIFNIFHSCSYWLVKDSPTSGTIAKAF